MPEPEQGRIAAVTGAGDEAAPGEALGWRGLGISERERSLVGLRHDLSLVY